MSVRTHIKAACRARAGLSAGKRVHAVRGFFNDISRWRCGRFCHGCRCGCECTHPVGAGSHVSERVWAAISAGAFDKTTSDPHHAQQRRRCSLGDGGRVAMHFLVFGDWRNLGRAPCIGFHGDKTSCHAGRGREPSLLAGAAGGRARPERGSEPLADCIVALSAASPRPAGPRRPALAGGAVPIPPGAARHMGGNP